MLPVCWPRALKTTLSDPAMTWDSIRTLPCLNDPANMEKSLPHAAAFAWSPGPVHASCTKTICSAPNSEAVGGLDGNKKG